MNTYDRDFLIVMAAAAVLTLLRLWCERRWP